MTVFRRRPLALAIAVSCVFSFAAQRLGFTPALRAAWLASGFLCAAAFFAGALIKRSARQVLTGLALLSVLLFCSFVSASLFFSLRIEPSRRLAEKDAFAVSGEVTEASDGFVVVSGEQKVSVSLYRLDGAPCVEKGDLVRIEVRPDAGPDSISDALWARGVFVKGTALSLEVTGKAKPGFIQTVKNALTEAFSSLRTPGVAQAMTFGVRGGEEETVRDALRRSGTAHLLSVSGLHVSLVLFAAVFFLEKSGAGPKACAAAVTVFALIYLSLLGFIPSAVRAAVMAWLFCLARALRRDYDPLTSLAVCVFAISLADPASWRSSSFVLSACATLGIIRVSIPLTDRLSASRRFESAKRLKAFLLACARDVLCGFAVTVGAVSFSLPVMMGVSRSFNVLAPAANLALGALFPVVLAPLFIHSAAFALLKAAGAPALTVYGAKICDLLLFVFEKCAVFFSDISMPLALWRPYTEKLVFFSVCALLLAAALIKLKPLKTAALGASALFVCFAVNALGLSLCRGEIAVINNGVGERAIILCGADRSVLVLDRDCRLADGFAGLCETVGAESFDAVVVLSNQDAQTLDAAFSLGGGAKLVIPGDLADALEEKLLSVGADFTFVSDGETLELDGAKIRICGTGERSLDIVLGDRVLCLREDFDGAPAPFSCSFGTPDAILLANCPSLKDTDGSMCAPLTVFVDNGPDEALIFEGNGSFYAANISGAVFTLNG